jgi:hypothetical protein
MKNPTTRWSLWLGAAVVLGCDPGEPVLEDVDDRVEVPSSVEDACEAMEACCGMEAPACAAELERAADYALVNAEYAAQFGIAFTRDEACPLLPFGAEIATRCVDETQCAAPCKPYVGTVAAGGACQFFGDIDDCAQGLLCFGTSSDERGVHTGVCDDPCDRVGQACDDLAAEYPTGGRYLGRGSSSCGPVGYCTDAGVCAAVHPPGAACPDAEGCAEGYYCDDASTCAPRLGPGEACTRTEACMDGSLCDGTSGTCIEEWEGQDLAAPLGCTWLETHGGG